MPANQFSFCALTANVHWYSVKLLVKKCGLHAKQILKNLSVFLVKTTTFDCQEKISIPFLGLGEGKPVWSTLCLRFTWQIRSCVWSKSICTMFIYTFLLYMYESMRAMLKKTKPGNAEAIKGKWHVFRVLFQIVSNCFFKLVSELSLSLPASAPSESSSMSSYLIYQHIDSLVCAGRREEICPELRPDAELTKYETHVLERLKGHKVAWFRLEIAVCCCLSRLGSSWRKLPDFFSLSFDFSLLCFRFNDKKPFLLTSCLAGQMENPGGNSRGWTASRISEGICCVPYWKFFICKFGSTSFPHSFLYIIFLHQIWNCLLPSVLLIFGEHFPRKARRAPSMEGQRATPTHYIGIFLMATWIQKEWKQAIHRQLWVYYESNMGLLWV